MNRDEQERRKREQDAANYERNLFLRFVASGLIVIAFVSVMAWLLGWI